MDSHLETTLTDAWPTDSWSEVGVLVAVSGGADSVALLRAMAALKTAGKGSLCAAHFDHQLRTKESAADQQFVLDLCRRIELPCELGHAEPGSLAVAGNDGIESAARAARYDFLRQTAERLGARYVVTAHTADDQAETILHRIVRGTGIGGLSGMARARPLGPAVTLIRPLLRVRRDELLAYLDELGQPYRSDSSNDDIRLTRNRIRHRLLPNLATDYNPAVSDALLRLGSLAAEATEVIDRMRDELADRCVRHPTGDASTVEINSRELTGCPRYVIRELLISIWRDQDWPLQSMGFPQWDLLADMLRSCNERDTKTPRKQMFPGEILAEVGEGGLTLRRSG